MSALKSVVVKTRECGCSKTFNSSEYMENGVYGKNVLLKLCPLHKQEFDTIDIELERILEDVHAIKARHALLLADLIQNK